MLAVRPLSFGEVLFLVGFGDVCSFSLSLGDGFQESLDLDCAGGIVECLIY